MSEPKRHHVVPEFYLKRFSHEGEIELVARDDCRAVISTGVSAALAQKHFYSIDTNQGRDTIVEKMFASEIEGPAARAIARVIDQRKPTSFPGLRGAIATFLAFQFVRGPAARHAAVEFFKAGARKVTSMATPEIVQGVLARQGEPISLSDARDLLRFAQSDDYRMEVSSEANVHLSVALKTALKLIPIFLQRSWTILDFPAPVLLTGDEPLALVGKSLSPGEALGATDAQEIVFPTDPGHALVLIRPDQKRRDARYSGTQRMADIINAHVAFNCHRFLIRYPGTGPLQERTIPEKAPPVMIIGDHVIIQPRVSLQGRRDWLRHQRRGR
jgi:hypothetical protein